METWQIGCFTRPWSAWSLEETLDGMKAAGFERIGLLGEPKGELCLSPAATPDYLDQLKQRITSRGLDLIFARLPTRHDIPLPEAIASVHQSIDHAHRLGVKHLMAFASHRPQEYEHYYRVMADAAAYAAPYQIEIAFKPHGGCTASADEMLECMEKVDHPNFGLWYDAGNIIHYTGKDPLTDVARVARYVTGFCAKDCAEQGSEVMIQFGEGAVDFAGVFRTLQSAGFHGPVMIECCAGGETLAEVTHNAQENRLFLERLRASL